MAKKKKQSMVEFIEEFKQVAVSLGFSKKETEVLVNETIRGSILMLVEAAKKEGKK